jgi:hypothetical protein
MGTPEKIKDLALLQNIDNQSGEYRNLTSRFHLKRQNLCYG